MSYHLGVDVGTTYTAAAIGRGGRVEAVTLGARSVSIPTVVCRSGERLLVGEPAARRALTDPGRVAREFKRRVGDPTPLLLGGSPVPAELCMARVVEWVVAQVAATEGEAPASLALTHPANWGEYKLDLLRQGLRHVDLAVDRFVPEPVAAATAYAAQRSLAPGTVVAVYDLGGGTFDAALVRAGDADAPGGAGTGARIVGRPDGVERLGGIDFDHAVYRHVLGAIDVDLDRLDPDDSRVTAALAQLREECVDAKEALSHEADVSIPVMLPERHTEVRLTRRELEDMVRPALDETLVALRRTIASAQLEVDDVAAVLLVGGSSRIPLVGQLVAQELGRPVAVDARPKDAISLGAAHVAMAAATAPAAGGARATGGAGVPLTAASLTPPTGGASELATTTAGDAPGAFAGGRAPDATVVGPGAPGEPAPVGRSAGATGVVPPPAVPVMAGGRPRGRSRALVGVLAAIVVLAAVTAGLLVARSGGSEAADDRPSDEPGDDPPDDEATDDTTTTSTPAGDPDAGTGGLDPAGSGGLGGLGGIGGTDQPAPDPLPGDDWSEAARVRFVEDCTSGIGTQAAVVGGDPAALCGCVYDDMATRVDFATFKSGWSSEEFDPGSEFGQTLTDAIFGCAASGNA